MNDKKIQLGNTGFSFDMLKANPEDTQPNPGEMVHKRDTIMDEGIDYIVFHPLHDRGPSFAWDWEERGEHGHSVQEYITIEKALYDQYNVGPHVRHKDACGDHLLAAGLGCCFLTGYVIPGDDTKRVDFYLDGSTAYTNTPDAVPVFTVNSELAMTVNGSNIILNNCIIEHGGVSYEITKGPKGEPPELIRPEVGCDEAFAYKIKNIMFDRRICRINRLLGSVEVASFTGPKGEPVPIRRCGDTKWINDGYSKMGYDVRVVPYLGEVYTYLSHVEVDKSVRAALKAFLTK